ncbi:hypothetical protein SAMN04490357_0276 [Streptomyces misionensis]|uniref:Uncharacterized protein n=1 Tax=Streptomyces misionensis TaxID=67331 RepID=A0A1H4LVG8_9ACTN|nr:hypothetical protein [Streptomyces misionensis]SEB74514.1 hypothetical protein SAMN04490357_0276 [Streptomyces misionensis]
MRKHITQLLATTGGVYDPETDAVVQDELAADRRAAEAKQHRIQEQQIAEDADELAALARAGRLDRSVETRPGDEAARDILVHRDDYHQVVDGWQVQAYASRPGHCADPAVRTTAAGSLPVAVRAHVSLLGALADLCGRRRAQRAHFTWCVVRDGGGRPAGCLVDEWVVPLHEALRQPFGTAEQTGPCRYFHIPKNLSDDVVAADDPEARFSDGER